jgi:hypothetical protein
LKGVLGDDSINHPDNAVGRCDNIEVVRDHHDRYALFAIQVAE